LAKIKILPEILSNKIAAGEVIERPASVVKELVENALDAGSTRILLTLQNAGKTLIQISDNGIGMNRDEALLSVERYATSKIVTDEDLFAIQTLGFRGEALPSIASVSRLVLESKDNDSPTGTQIQIEGGKIKAVHDIGAPTGTQITVKQLFFNTPARRKFLKTTATEMSHVVDTLSSMAMAWPQVQFRLTHNGKIVKDWQGVENPVDRISNVIAQPIQNELFPVTASHNGVSVQGWISSNRIHRSTSRGIYLYINKRFVRDRIIQHALMAGFSGKLVAGRYPVAVLFLSVPFDEVDVNVHPSKHAVRFASPNSVHDLVQRAVSSTLQEQSRLSWSAPAAQSHAVPNPPPSQKNQNKDAVSPVSRGAKTSLQPSRIFKEENYSPTKRFPSQTIAESQPPLWQTRFFKDLKVIGQFRDAYILCDSNQEGLILIDQHAAHERIMFEKLKHAHSDGAVESQRLMMPETLELGFKESNILEQLLPELSRYGLDIEPFGGSTFVIKATPSLLSNKDIGPLVMDIVEKIADLSVAKDIDQILDQVFKLMACHGAIRANQSLSTEQISALLDQLDACEDPSHCPHGRPTWIQWRLSSIEKAFLRIV
jgi:DNA mismatch repair protein MutL